MSLYEQHSMELSERFVILHFKTNILHSVFYILYNLLFMLFIYDLCCIHFFNLKVKISEQFI